MAVQEASLNNLKPGQYLSNPENRALITNNSRKGKPNRTTVANKWLDVQIEVTDLKNDPLLCTVEDAIFLAQARKAIAYGDTNAATFCFDMRYGKIKAEESKMEPIEGVNLSLLSTDELKIMAALERKARGLPPIDEGEYIESIPVSETPE